MTPLDLAQAGELTGTLAKMPATLDKTVRYSLSVGEWQLPLNPLLGRKIVLEHTGAIHCTHCGKKTKKSFSQGYCYVCFKRLPQCDLCIMSPEKCHYDQGTCRDSRWGDQFCMTDHIVYLANSSGLKVGITRATQIPVRWIDQGATQALPFFRVATRYLSGLVEVLFKAHVNDRTNWRAMLKGPAEAIDVQDAATALLAGNQRGIEALRQAHGLRSVQALSSPEPVTLDYPVLEYPTKVISRSFDKTPVIEGTLMGIKGQYLLLDTGVVNIRKHTAYQVHVSVQ
ncbi:DUF2797 domain-containing protein [Candidatus Sororendozoicomonas aggregata]|uniref:DUF2797 domain-containing protein n=1 Tax=Candidatus Sororendozoicomonas aggregata TaxID=3073239 RepID=UPI002ED3C68B